ncbi:MAG: D-methionine transport system permease protein [Candidatus Phytoplasma cynodontis]|uniref:ABC transporter permease n=1 Tax='Cynodon dactylon' phytoplasma TaxID=295320 RepID=UPI0012C9959A|nr:ABC transporter permease ['Cynodon dactylon' phytoplasma]KAB8122050.1 ABC transporter permease subunit ['Cynodon dactylon' phytoplasma]WIA07534.1 MAG: D-methionine transport system permease protein [Candidatus Phytoplasma cynodontis]
MLKENLIQRIYNVLIFPNNNLTKNDFYKPFLLLDNLIETIKITFFSTFISFFLGLFLSIILYFIKLGEEKIFNKIVYFLINFFINFILSMPFMLLIFLIIDFILTPYLNLFYGFKVGLICLVLVLTAHATRILEQVFLQINPEIYKTAYSLGSNKIQFVKYFLLVEAKPYLILKLNSLYVSSMAYSSVLAIVGVKGLAYIIYEYGIRGTENFSNFENSDLILVYSIVIFIWMQIIHFFSILISNRLNKVF